MLQGRFLPRDKAVLKLCSALRHECGELGGCACDGAVAALRGRELRRVYPQVLARYKGLGLASLLKHVLALGQPLRVLVLGLTAWSRGIYGMRRLNQEFCWVFALKYANRANS